MEVTLYVKGVKTCMGIDDRSHWGYIVTVFGPAPSPYGGDTKPIPDYKVYREPEYKSILPEDQRALVEMVKVASVKYGFKLTIIDVTKQSILHKLEDRLMGIRIIPTLETDTGVKIEGDITEERIKTLFAK